MLSTPLSVLTLPHTCSREDEGDHVPEDREHAHSMPDLTWGSDVSWSANEACLWLHRSVGRQLLNALLIPDNPPGLYNHPGPICKF